MTKKYHVYSYLLFRFRENEEAAFPGRWVVDWGECKGFVVGEGRSVIC